MMLYRIEQLNLKSISRRKRQNGLSRDPDEKSWLVFWDSTRVSSFVKTKAEYNSIKQFLRQKSKCIAQQLSRSRRKNIGKNILYSFPNLQNLQYYTSIPYYVCRLSYIKAMATYRFSGLLTEIETDVYRYLFNGLESVIEIDKVVIIQAEIRLLA